MNTRLGAQSRAFGGSVRIAFGIAAALGFGGLAACGDDEDKGDKLSADDYNEVATTMGALVSDESRGESSAYGGAVLLARGELPLDFEISGGFAVGELLGLQYSFGVLCRDAGGAEVNCGAGASTAAIDVSWSGEWNSEDITASSDFDGDWTLSSLDQDLIILNGTASANADARLIQSNGNERSWHVDYSATYNGVGLDADTRRAVSGSVEYDLVVQREFNGQFTDTKNRFVVDAEVSFESDGTAMLVLDSDQVYRLRRNGSVELVARGTID